MLEVKPQTRRRGIKTNAFLASHTAHMRERRTRSCAAESDREAFSGESQPTVRPGACRNKPAEKLDVVSVTQQKFPPSLAF